ncbi:hypothetical protein ACJX0J_026930, partial [Zea mays]
GMYIIKSVSINCVSDDTLAEFLSHLLTQHYYIRYHQSTCMWEEYYMLAINIYNIINIIAARQGMLTCQEDSIFSQALLFTLFTTTAPVLVHALHEDAEREREILEPDDLAFLGGMHGIFMKGTAHMYAAVACIISRFSRALPLPTVATTTVPVDFGLGPKMGFCACELTFCTFAGIHHGLV